MGVPKLLLKLGSVTVMHRLVTALKAAGVDRIFVLVRGADLPLQRELETLDCEAVIATTDPPEMRDSVELLIQHVSARCSPTEHDHWLLIPADHPIVEAGTVKQLVDATGAAPDSIILPTYQGQRGHPTLFPWSIAGEVAQIPRDKGLNWLVRRDDSRVIELPVTHESVLFDLDTPDDFERAKNLVGTEDN
jgi:molybdenum cofactor cytidylyltransferase